MDQPTISAAALAIFERVRTKIDAFLGTPDDVEGSPFNLRFEYLFQTYGDEVADWHRFLLIGEDENENSDSVGAFDESTQKHQVFDYFPYDQWPEREFPVNDLATVLAGYIAEGDEHETDPDERFEGGLDYQLEHYRGERASTIDGLRLYDQKTADAVTQTGRETLAQILTIVDAPTHNTDSVSDGLS